MIANLELFQTIERVHVHRKTYHIRRFLYILEISGCVLLVEYHKYVLAMTTELDYIV